ncbi:Replicase polyprotein 1ab [Actinoplanes sp. SE50]|uniref:Replicase polyprotein 1ab n=1 Tax=unclassified Actinoplanes TaxID=2626549 RepID=UPI00023ED111|nr:Replicase polyprotein 1ab [Actinoplanes sp. SE50/110]ATO85645.1 Replicase polyprotein 1ab [Actinoplanes sp. SE50]SLM03058.1 Replicase polyprotein 1ab [Actinoplanes sp. SE50/110]
MAAGTIIDEDSEVALQHAIAARRLASRIAVVREAVGLAAYAAGDWTTAIAELRTYHRMTGRQTHLAEIADCERALGRPERAIDLYRGADMAKLEKSGAIELLIVAAGARGDLGQHDAAVAMLQVKELTAEETADWAARLRYAYADALLAAGRRDEAREWFVRAAAVDEDQLTDAAERILELDGVVIEGDDEDDEDLDDDAAEDGEGGDVRARSGADDDEDRDDDEDEDLDDEDRADSDEDDDFDDEDDEDDDTDEADAEPVTVAETDVNTDAVKADKHEVPAAVFEAPPAGKAEDEDDEKGGDEFDSRPDDRPRA